MGAVALWIIPSINLYTALEIREAMYIITNKEFTIYCAPTQRVRASFPNFKPQGVADSRINLPPELVCWCANARLMGKGQG